MLSDAGALIGLISMYMSDAGINWSDINVMSDAGINWSRYWMSISAYRSKLDRYYMVMSECRNQLG